MLCITPEVLSLSSRKTSPRSVRKMSATRSPSISISFRRRTLSIQDEDDEDDEGDEGDVSRLLKPENRRITHEQLVPNETTVSMQDDDQEGDVPMLLQPETSPITQDQLVNEVKAMYAGLVMVEEKCVEICNQQQQSDSKHLSHEQWQALIALHRSLLHEHHDFFLALQHPSASQALRHLGIKCVVPPRMWRHGIYSFLELIRHRLPDSNDHMLSFIYLAYSMIALMMETIPSFRETWRECLADLARYEMAIEEADCSPNVGRIQHHLAILARPNSVPQLFYYSKALASILPCVNAQESIMLLYTPFLDAPNSVHGYPPTEASLGAFGLLLSNGDIKNLSHLAEKLQDALDSHIARIDTSWKLRRPEVASSLIAALLDYGTEDKSLWDLILAQHCPGDRGSTEAQSLPTQENACDRLFTSDPITRHDLSPWSRIVCGAAENVGDRDIVPYLHVALALLCLLSFAPANFAYLEAYIPWPELAVFLNTIGCSAPRLRQEYLELYEFLESISGVGNQVPEDLIRRRSIWAHFYYSQSFFTTGLISEDEQGLEPPSHAPSRSERCLWLGFRLASVRAFRKLQHLFTAVVDCSLGVLEQVVSLLRAMLARGASRQSRPCSTPEMILTLLTLLSPTHARPTSNKNQSKGEIEDGFTTFFRSFAKQVMLWAPWSATCAAIVWWSRSGLPFLPNPTAVNYPRRMHGMASLLWNFTLLVLNGEEAAPQVRYPVLVACTLELLQYGEALFPELVQTFDLRPPVFVVAGALLWNGLLCFVMSPNQGIDVLVYMRLLPLAFWLTLTFASFREPIVEWLKRIIRRAGQQALAFVDDAQG